MVHSYKDSQTLEALAKGVGKMGSTHESLSTQCINILCHLSKPALGLRILRSVVHSFHSIGSAWSKKKSIFTPLIEIMKRPDSKLRIDCINAIKTQLEGYWERPVDVLKNIIINDDDYQVRCAAVMSLGELGEFGALSIRESIYELIEAISKQVLGLKHEMAKTLKKGPTTIDVQYKLKDSKEILKILYHYAKVYKYRLSR